MFFGGVGLHFLSKFSDASYLSNSFLSRNVGRAAAFGNEDPWDQSNPCSSTGARKILLINKDLHQGKTCRINRCRKILPDQYFSLIFYDDSAYIYLQSKDKSINDFEETLLHAIFRFWTHKQLNSISQCLKVTNIVRLGDGSLEMLFLSQMMNVKRSLELIKLPAHKFSISLVENWRYLLVDNMSSWWPSFSSLADSIQ